MKPKFFGRPDQFREWLERNHDRETELLIGFHKKASGKPSVTYNEALDEALCFGWIDGVRKNLNETSYTIRFTPRKARSIWSNVNVNHVERLIKEKRMHASGLEAYERRDPERTGIYAFENIPPGEYLVVAIPDEKAATWRDPKFLSTLAAAATRVSISDGAGARVDLQTRVK